MFNILHCSSNINIIVLRTPSSVLFIYYGHVCFHHNALSVGETLLYLLTNLAAMIQTRGQVETWREVLLNAITPHLSNTLIYCAPECTSFAGVMLF